MKRIYLSFLALSVGTLAFGQLAKTSAIPHKTEGNAVKTSTLAPQDKGAVIWSDDFTTPGNWTIANTGTPSADWVIGTAAPSGSFSVGMGAITSTSGGNFAMFDSDALGSGSSVQDATITTAASFSTLGNSNVSVVFESYYRHYQGACFLEVSTNGTTFTQFPLHTGVAVNSGTANPEPTAVNVSAVAGNQATVWLRFRYTGGWDYAWMIDDVEVQVTDDNDLVAGEPFFGMGANLIRYSRIPSCQIAPISFSMKAQNVGAVDQTNTVLTADVNGGTFTGTSAATTVVAGATDSLFTTTQYTPATTVGVPLNVTLSVASDSTDATPGNNGFVFPPFEVSNGIYALDMHSTTPNTGGGLDNNTTPPSAEFEAGNYLDVVTNDNALSVDVYVGTGTPAGTPIEGVLYEDNGTFVQVDRSFIYTTTAGDVGTLVNLPLPLQPAINAGSIYFVAVHAYTEFNYGVSGTGPGNPSASGPTSLIFYPNMTAPATGQNYYTTAIPMIRLNTSNCGTVGVNETASKNNEFTVYPNPSAGIFTIDLADLSANANLTVRNVVGQTVIAKTIAANSTKETISLANYGKGIYFLTIDNKTTKLIVE